MRSEQAAGAPREPLAGRVAVVAGATRGGGRGIALALAAAGATVYATGRSTSVHLSPMRRPETIDATVESIRSAGGRAVALAVDYRQPDQVEALFARVMRDEGRLDVLVNSIWGGDPLTRWGEPFWSHPLRDGLELLHQAVDTHLIASRYAAAIMAQRRAGLIVEVTDGVGYRYRGSLYYSLAKVAAVHAAEAMARDLAPFGATALAITPGFMRSEAVLEHLGVTEGTWRQGIAKDPHFAFSETPLYLGRAVAALAADPDVASLAGRSLATWELVHRYGFTDADGRRPDWGAHWQELVDGGEVADPAPGALEQAQPGRAGS